VPPLRDRPEDISVLAAHFVRIYGAKNNRKLEGLTDEAVRQLEAFSWPGNIRQLENVIERAVVIAEGPVITTNELPLEMWESGSTRPTTCICTLSPSARAERATCHASARGWCTS